MSVVRSKICGITRIEDALSAAEAGADAIGLVFYAKSPRAVSVQQARAIIAALPPFVTTVGLFVDASRQELDEILAAVPLDLLQFHGDESPEECERLAAGDPWIKAGRVGEGFAFADFSLQYRQAAGFLLDALVEGYGGGGVPFDWQWIPEAWVSANAPRVVLSGGLNAHNVGEAIARLQPCAVDISSGVESAKGIKDAVLMAQFIEAVRLADSKKPMR